MNEAAEYLELAALLAMVPLIDLAAVALLSAVLHPLSRFAPLVVRAGKILSLLVLLVLFHRVWIPRHLPAGPPAWLPAVEAVLLLAVLAAAVLTQIRRPRGGAQA